MTRAENEYRKLRKSKRNSLKKLWLLLFFVFESNLDIVGNDSSNGRFVKIICTIEANYLLIKVCGRTGTLYL